MCIDCKQIEVNGKAIKLYTTKYNGKTNEATNIHDAMLHGMGYGANQAAELRYMFSKKVTE